MNLIHPYFKKIIFSSFLINDIMNGTFISSDKSITLSIEPNQVVLGCNSHHKFMSSVFWDEEAVSFVLYSATRWF